MKKSNYQNLKLLSKIHCKRCVVCGKNFGVKIAQNGEILTDCFYNELDLNHFDGWFYIFDGNKKDPFKDPIRHYKNKFYKIVGFSHWSRELVYWLWNIFHKKAKFEFWECPKCCTEQ